MTRRTLTILFLIVCSYLAPTTVSAQEIGLKQPSFDSAGVPIHYIVRGAEDAEAVVLIHGFADRMEPMWTQAIAALKGNFKVIALDCRGHGGSGKPHDPNMYGIEMANDVARLLDHLKIDKAHIVGYSMGARIALRVAIYHPQRVRSVTLGGSNGVNREQEDLIVTVAESLEKGNGFGPLLIGLAPKDRPKPTPEAIKIVDSAMGSKYDVKVLAAVARSAVADKLTDEQIKSVGVPVLAIIGADDPLRVGMDPLKELLPRSKIVVIDKADHMTACTRPEFINSLRQFLEDNRQSPVK